MLQLLEKETKRAKLNALKEQLNLVVEGRENYPFDRENPIIFIANHSCLKDIFYLAMAIPESYVTVVSNRLLYKKDQARKDLINEHLHALPLEVAPGFYGNISLAASSDILLNGISIGIFPEGAYNDRTLITRGRTGIAIVLFQVRNMGVKPIFLPVAIDVKSDEENLNSYHFRESDSVCVKILDRVDYEKYYFEYIKSWDRKEQNEMLHEVVDAGMKQIADALALPYSYDYINLDKKTNIMFQDGSTISLEEQIENQNIERFQNEIYNQTRKLVRSLKDCASL